MHFSLRLEAAAALPPSFRKHVLAASKGSLTDWRQLNELTRQGYRQAGLFLPALYACLDPSAIPTPAALDEMLVARISARPLLGKVVLALTAVCTFPTSPAASIDIWPRAWAWIEFVFSYRDVLSDLPSEIALCRHFVEVIWNFVSIPEVAVLVDATPGVRVVVGRAWSCLIDDADEPSSLDNLTSIIGRGRMPDWHVDEYMEGVGEAHAFAALVVKFIYRSLAGPELYLDLAGVLSFMSSINSGHPIHALLRSHGIITALVQTILKIPLATAGNTISPYALQLLRTQLHLAGGYWYLKEAFQNGFLQAIILSCARAGADMDLDPLRSFLGVILPNSTVYYSLLIHLEAAFLEIDVDATDKRLATSLVVIEWRAFVKFAQQRFKIKELFDTTHISRKACDNLACSFVGAKSKFRCCSACTGTYYCSPDCQRIDWREGGHRKICRHIRAHSIASPRVGKRDITFIRTLLDYDYAAHSNEIFTRHIFAAGLRLEHEVCVDFQYRGGVVNFEPLPFPGEHDPKLGPLTDWDAWLRDCCGRAMRSDGRMEVHLFSLYLGNELWKWVFPFRRRSSVVRDGLFLLGRSMERDEEGPVNYAGLEADVERLQDMDKDAFH
ncbi:hypothetical protein C8R46DRAFT_1343919 [Mycena filopes]|nr:hypothetical protein C8R46DRAFT_1343919 [Mycena filopes]